MMASSLWHDGMIRTQIQFEPDDLTRLQAAAMRSGCSVSAYVRQAVRDALGRERDAQCVQAVMELAGKYDSGSRDLARNHGEALDDGW
jgi:hypothetical protein